MTVGLLARGGTAGGEAIGVASLDEIAAAIRDQAVAAARDAVVPGQRWACVAELFDRPNFRRSFGQALARGVAQALAANDQRVLAVYAYAAAPARDASVEREVISLAHLLVIVTAPSAALEAFATALNRALGVSLSGIIEPQFGPCQSLLDINILTELQRQQGLGLARLLSEIRPRPVKLWQRQA